MIINKKVILKAAVIFAAFYVITLAVKSQLDEGFIRLIVVCFASLFTSILSALCILNKEERQKAKFILEQLINYYMNNTEKLPELYKEIVMKEGKERGIVDYLAGMSDDYCLHEFNKIFVPKTVIY